MNAKALMELVQDCGLTGNFPKCTPITLRARAIAFRATPIALCDIPIAFAATGIAFCATPIALRAWQASVWEREIYKSAAALIPRHQS